MQLFTICELLVIVAKVYCCTLTRFTQSNLCSSESKGIILAGVGLISFKYSEPSLRLTSPELFLDLPSREVSADREFR